MTRKQEDIMECAGDTLPLATPLCDGVGLRDEKARRAVPEEMSDRDVVQVVLGGETGLFEQIVFRYEKPIYRHVYRMVGSVEDAEDLTQDTFVKAYSHLNDYCQAYPFRAWLFRIATNTAISALRKRHRHGSLDDPSTTAGAGALPDPDAKSPRSVAAASEMMGLLEEAVGKLSPLGRAVFNLRYSEEMKVDEIAQALGRKPGAVAVMLHRVRERLSRALSGAERQSRIGGYDELQASD